MCLKNLHNCWKKIFGTYWPRKNNEQSESIIQPVTFEDFRIFLPKYLSDEEQEELFGQLKTFREYPSGKFFASQLLKQESLFQGDGYTEIEMPDYQNKSYKKVKGFLISNSCDADSDNEHKRIYNTSLVFGPLIDIKKYEEMLNAVHDKKKVRQHIKDIKEQRITSFFYLPESQSLEECFVMLDKIFSIPASMCDVKEMCGNRLFVLSNLGHYLLLFKLSVHFSRVQESLQRI